MVFIIMGVSGSGKSTVGKMLADKLQFPFYDADSFHSKENIEKMAKGIALTDVDREPWLKSLRKLIKTQTGNTVIACSALKKSYRDVLDVPGSDVVFIYLKGERETLEKRLSDRKNHYAGVSLLESQLDTLEEPIHSYTLDITETPKDLVQKIITHYSL